jgi:phosphatidylserine/phosphatidylglycerophosphate/cardiolipin synthase-like enzyme
MRAVRHILMAGLLPVLFAGVAEAACRKPVEDVCFTPGGDCTGLIVGTIGAARREILVQAYGFTSAPIAKALTDAKKRGVEVKAILDKSNRTDKYGAGTFLVNAGIPTWIDDKVAIAHNKVMVIDGEKVITGSFNFTKSAQSRNAENVVTLCDAATAAQYRANWLERQRVSSAFER